MHRITRREVAKAGGALFLGAAFREFSFGSELNGRRSNIDPLARVDPELRSAAERWQKMAAQFPALNDKNLASFRVAGASFQRPPLDTVPVSEQRIPGVGAAPEVLIYIINSQAGLSRPAILHTHGGGYVAGSAKGSIRDAQEIAMALDCTVVTVEYRLAPETNFLGSIEDNYAALRWTHAHSSEIGVDPARLALLGESAGGGHAALLAIVARDRGEVPLRLQVLIYPMLDDRTASSRPVPKHLGTFIWTADDNRFGWRSFLGQEPGSKTVPNKAVPARVADLSGLPPTFIGVGSLDLFVEEDIEYARRLIDAGVPTELCVVPGAFHGFDVIERDAPVSVRFTEEKLGSLRRALGVAMRPAR